MRIMKPSLVSSLKGMVAVLSCFAVVLFLAAPANAELRIDITRGTVKPLPIAITIFIGKPGVEQQYGRDMSKVISANLERSGLFKPISQKAFIQSARALNTLPRFGDWRVINAQALVQGQTVLEFDGRLHVKFRLWDVFAEQQMVGMAYKTAQGGWRRVAHIISDAIYKRITGEDGYFDTRVVYIAERGLQNRRIKRLAIMDQDGENHRFLTDGSALVLTPRFSPTLQEITYMSFYQNVPRVYLFNIDTGRQEIVGEFPGMTFAPRFSPNGKSLIMSMAKDGNSEIYTLDMRTRAVKKLTNHSAIDTSPSYSPDASRVVFNSDRGGSQQLYTMTSSGRNVRRISFGKGRYATPVWSPRGDLVAFTKMRRGRFYIGVMRPDGSGERLLAEGFSVESPTWAPNGRVLMFYRQKRFNSKGGGGRARVFTIDLTGHNEREIVTPLDASDPAWSPLIQ